MTWLARLKNQNVPDPGTDRTAKTPVHMVSSVSSVPTPANLKTFQARPVVQFRLAGHPSNAWATCVARPGESREACIAGLKARWPRVEVRL